VSREKGRGPNWALIWTIIGVLLAGVGLLYISGILHPFPAPTATLNLTPFTVGPDCGPDYSTVDLHNIWQSDVSHTTTLSCGTGQFTIVQAPNARAISSVRMKIPQPHYQPDRDYSILVYIALGTQNSCAGVIFRSSPPRDYFVEICGDGEWAVLRSYQDIIETVQSGKSVLAGDLFRLNVEVSHDTLNAEIFRQVEGGNLSLPQVNLDPTFQDGYIGLFVDGHDPARPRTNPGASASFEGFVFTPLP
jgi:hypothetical protein